VPKDRTKAFFILMIITVNNLITPSGVELFTLQKFFHDCSLVSAPHVSYFKFKLTGLNVCDR
jgi:hypothetical protein